LEDLKVLIPKEKIAQKVKEIGDLITIDYKDKGEVVLVCNLKGGFIFLADLCRSIGIRVLIDFIATSSYKGTETNGDVRIVKDLKTDVKGKHVILIEDIVDTGYTLKYIMQYLKLHDIKSLKVCTFLDKRCKRKVNIDINYIGFQVDDKFLVGYGLDYNEKYRELDYIAELILGR